MLLSVNDTVVGQLPDPRPGAAVGVGLVAASNITHVPADARFDNFAHQGVGGGAWRVAGGAWRVEEGQ